MKNSTHHLAVKVREEKFNTISHAVGIIMGVAATALLVTFSALWGNVWQVVSFGIFGASLITLYTASTLYHGASRPRLKFYLNKFDHSAIFVLIAGSYTPVALAMLGGAMGWVLFGVTWTIATAGIVYKIWFYSHRHRKVSAWLYVGMGWQAMFVIKPLMEQLPVSSLWLIIGGGIAYTAGVLFYIQKGRPLSHFVFHLFVLGGSILHVLAFILYTISFRPI
ncbi:MAG TPA: hemolysin III family protein [Bacteroidales bacterium]|nr:hemolysin III family protein [Bacteroidales bacterium]